MEGSEYELRGILSGHSKGVRCLCVVNKDIIKELKDYQLNFEYIVSADCTGAIVVWKKGGNGEEKENTMDGNNNDKHEGNEKGMDSCKDESINSFSDNFYIYKNVEIHEKFVYSLCCSKYVGIKELMNSKEDIEDHLHVYSGGSDRNIYLFNLNGYIELVLQGHKNSICSIIEKSENILLSGDWNGEVFMWEINKSEEEKEKDFFDNNSTIYSDRNSNMGGKNNYMCGYKYTYTILKVLDGHKHATYVNCMNDLILTISQNNILHIWNEDGYKTDEIKNIHSDSVRDIILFNENKNAITFSNDENIHIYDSNFNLLKIYKGHEGFIFYVCVNEKEKIMYSCSDDKSIKIWCIKDIYELMEKYDIRNLKNQHLICSTNFSCLQTIHLTDTLWNVKLLHNNDFVCASNDKHIRIYTNKKEHKLSKDIIQQIDEKINKKNDGYKLNEENVTSVENIKNVLGKEGEIKIFKNREKYEAYKYEKNQWVLIGDVVDDANSDKKFYIGDHLFSQGYYDEIFSIDTGYGTIKQLPYNVNDNIHLIAEKFCKREGISLSHIKSIVDFINQNCSTKNNPCKSIQSENGKKKKFNTVLNVFTVQKASLDKILQKIKEFNSLLTNTDEGKCKLLTEEMNSLSNIINVYKTDIKNGYKFNTADINLITKLFQWSPLHIFPIIDLFRVLILNKNCDFLFNNKYSFNVFKLVYDCISYYVNNQLSNPNNNEENKLDSLLLCCLRFYLNMFSLSTPRYYIFKKCNFLFKQLPEIKSDCFNINILIIKIFFNYVIALNENNDNELRKTLFQIIHSFSNKINEVEFLYTYTLCFHTSYNTYTKQTEDIIKKYDTINIIKNKLKSLFSQKNEQNEKFFKNVELILEDLEV
ncbi:polyubiquitin binding protein, putative [Plasmodium ovale]|uniref:Polyubiquitin binding protein, putative n=2 Tax=Plasmodium ovale TaxID=36330 RepID=A0A1A8VWT1_PLAOA|nr:polyubiquitin binding protein, putative [Plasmodium ovale curtisi]SBS93579.1 polyubiquitin binding protein, putative [Plasmodium ovale curtisi]SCP04871.1 polyubiquitin binding protein, putative [Plasmodium ovale]